MADEFAAMKRCEDRLSNSRTHSVALTPVAGVPSPRQIRSVGGTQPSGLRLNFWYGSRTPLTRNWSARCGIGASNPACPPTVVTSS